MKGCTVLVADPAWRFKDSLPGPRRGAEKTYKAGANGRSTLSVPEICRFPLPLLAPDCTLFLWRVAAIQRGALDVARIWGFGDEPKSELVWNKLTAKGLRHFGMGRRFRMEHEVCLVFTRGRPPWLDHGIRSTFDAPVPTEMRIVKGKLRRCVKHSAKPPEFFEIVARACGRADPRTHVELFAREERPGWSTYGNELERAHPEAA